MQQKILREECHFIYIDNPADQATLQRVLLSACSFRGVADGVGGWRAWGIDPGEFSSTLMQSCERLVSTGSFCPTAPASLLAKAYSELELTKKHILGSSTACLVMLRGHLATNNSVSSSDAFHHNETERKDCEEFQSDETASGVLSSANIGDSGYLVVRGGHVVHRSHEQQHYFNTPFQLSMPPPGTSGHVLSDSPASADSREFEVEAGDLLLVATDGVFDNLPVPCILQLLQTVQGTSELSELQSAANRIAQQARLHAFDEDYMSPFALNARQNGINTRGGKPDDITVVLAAVLGSV
ncbi:protein phosphatase PTC7 homolog isoform X2 [Hyalella azteca]|uniref:Protein phosphatase n=1 Tax=Hyalella azteca TaxID=294128 RepID=A0A8B7P7D6_HYAAZ|nr:protein phosphatase PTC7 homolog isoform X2 [Hyalella azteca]